MQKSFRVSDYMQRAVISVSPEWQIMRAVHLFVKKDISGAPVLDKDGNLLGMLTERDCITVALSAGYFDEPGGVVADFMTSPVKTVAENDSLMDIATRFRDTPYRRFPVMGEGRMTGIISRRDILRAMTRGTWFS